MIDNKDLFKKQVKKAKEFLIKKGLVITEKSPKKIINNG